MAKGNIISHREFEVLLKDAEFMAEVMKQLLKDLSLSGINVKEVNIDVPLNQILEVVSGLIDHIFNNQPGQLQTLLYQADIPENLIVEEQLAEEQANLSKVVAQLLIKRIMLKVVTRMRYS